MVERWAPVAGFPGYEVSDKGNVRSWRPRDGRGTAACPHLLTPQTKEGYPCVGFSMSGRVVWRTVHTLVATAFIGERPEGHVCCHGDGNRQNNSVSNLRWATDEENKADQLAHGTRAAGARHYRKKIGREAAATIRVRLSKGESIKAVCRDTGLSTSAVSAIKNNKAWKESV